MTKSKYGRILAISTAICIGLLGILLIVCCAHLYFTGGSTPYSRSRVGDYLVYLIAPAAAVLILVVSSFVYNYITGQKSDDKALRANSEMLESFLMRYDYDSFDESAKKEIKKIRKTRSIVDLISSEISAFCLVFIVDYLLFIANFSVEDLNADILSAFAVVLPVAAVAIAVHVPRVYLAEKSAERELLLLKESLKNGNGEKAVRAEETTEQKANACAIARYVVVGAAIALIILGITNGGMGDVLQKAVKICTECIGLG